MFALSEPDAMVVVSSGFPRRTVEGQRAGGEPNEYGDLTPSGWGYEATYLSDDLYRSATWGVEIGCP